MNKALVQEVEVAENELLLLTEQGYALAPGDDLSQFLGRALLHKVLLHPGPLFRGFNSYC